jgi:hypothetical protein
MAFFCNRTGVRIVAPGVHESVQPDGVALFDDSDLAKAAERTALNVLRDARLSDEEASPSVVATERARLAAKKIMSEGAKFATPKVEPNATKSADADRPDVSENRGGRRVAPKNEPKPEPDKTAG